MSRTRHHRDEWHTIYTRRHRVVHRHANSNYYKKRAAVPSLAPLAVPGAFGAPHVDGLAIDPQEVREPVGAGKLQHFTELTLVANIPKMRSDEEAHTWAMRVLASLKRGAVVNGRTLTTAGKILRRGGRVRKPCEYQGDA